jgi:hypothetical protein
MRPRPLLRVPFCVSRSRACLRNARSIWTCRSGSVPPDAVPGNIAALAALPPDALADRVPVNLPGITVTPREVLNELDRRFGVAAVKLVQLEKDLGI